MGESGNPVGLPVIYQKQRIAGTGAYSPLLVMNVSIGFLVLMLGTKSSTTFGVGRASNESRDVGYSR